MRERQCSRSCSAATDQPHHFDAISWFDQRFCVMGASKDLFVALDRYPGALRIELLKECGHSQPRRARPRTSI